MNRYIFCIKELEQYKHKVSIGEKCIIIGTVFSNKSIICGVNRDSGFTIYNDKIKEYFENIQERRDRIIEDLI